MKRALGVCYYPEHWSETEWSKDAARMVAAGLTWVRIGEFAWSRMEPSQDELNFDWFDRAIETLGEVGLKVVLGTPTATPPRWVVAKHPTMLALAADGNPRKFGSRRHYCFSHEGYLQECRRIVRILAERYGGNPYVAAWQIDNEFGCHGTTISYSEAALHGFRQWLSDRYQTIDALNAAWGNAFWSMEYSDFDDIDLPNLTVTQPNPAHAFAFRKFSSDQIVRFNRAQVEILRRYTEAPLIHNFMGRLLEFDHFAVASDLDITSWDSYPLGFLADRSEATDARKQRFLRQGDPDFQAFHHDLYRAVGRGRWWVMEQQPGPVNWAPYNPAPLPGMVRLWTWEAFAHGAEVVSYFRWRQAPFAQEQMHAGLLRPDNETSPAFEEVRQVAEEIEENSDVETASSPVALVFDYASSWSWEIQPQGAGFEYFTLCFSAYRALRRAGLSVDIVGLESREFSNYRLVLAPAIASLPQALMNVLHEFGGTIVFGPRTNAKTPEMSVPVPLPPNLPGLDITVVQIESLPPDAPVGVKGGGQAKIWFEEIKTREPVAFATKDDRPILVGRGHYYLAGWPDDDFWDRIVYFACERSGLSALQLPDGLRVRDTGTHRFVLNYDLAPQNWDGREIPAAGLAWWPLN